MKSVRSERRARDLARLSGQWYGYHPSTGKWYVASDMKLRLVGCIGIKYCWED